MNHSRRLFPALLAVLLLAASCSTTRVLQEGEYRLAKNGIEITNSKKFDPSSLNQYIKQQPNSTLFGWNPFLSIYNWAAPDNDSGMARMLRKIGTAPVVYSPDAVESTIDNITNHLEYIGYYNSQVSSDIHVSGRKVAVTYLVHLGKQYLRDGDFDDVINCAEKLTELCEKHYNIMHTLSVEENLQTIREYCLQKGGNL